MRSSFCGDCRFGRWDVPRGFVVGGLWVCCERCRGGVEVGRRRGYGKGVGVGWVMGFLGFLGFVVLDLGLELQSRKLDGETSAL